METEQPLVFDFDAVFEVDDYMYFYRESLTEERSEAEVQALANLLDLKEPMKILDLACGFGRHANRLAALSHSVTGLDFSTEFLDIARKDAVSKKLQVNYVQGDMRKIAYESMFDRVLLLFTAFGYFDDEENVAVLRNVYRALVPGGKFIFDIPNRDTFLKFTPSCFVTESGDDMMIDRMSIDPILRRSINRRLVIRNGIRKEKPFSIRLYNASEIVDLLESAVFRIFNFYGDWDATPLTEESRRLIVVADK